MYVYQAILIASFLSFFLVRNKWLNYAIISTFTVVLCFGYMSGTDWRAYEEIYNSYQDDNFWWRLLFMEPFYLLTNVIGNELGIGFWPFYLFIKVLIFLKVINILQSYSYKRSFYLTLTFYLGFWGIMIFIDTPFRNMIAVYVFLSFHKYLLNGNLFKYVFGVLLATLFHYSAIILIFLYPVLKLKLSTRQILVSLLIINILFISPSVIFGILAKVLFFVPGMSLKIASYTTGAEAETTGSGKLFSFGYALHLLLFAIIMLKRKKIEMIPYGDFMFKMSVCYIFIFRIGLTVLVFSRIQLYVSPFYAVTIGALIYSLTRERQTYYCLMIYCFAVLSNYSQMHSVTMVPYTNYLFYINKDLPYDYRSEYNYRMSPYKN